MATRRCASNERPRRRIAAAGGEEYLSPVAMCPVVGASPRVVRRSARGALAHRKAGDIRSLLYRLSRDLPQAHATADPGLGRLFRLAPIDDLGSVVRFWAAYGRFMAARLRTQHHPPSVYRELGQLSSTSLLSLH
eukprot:CAMPEP_0176188534 /NCGR_PEP_ID=MMETSP0121_2-20121125/2964_1 /TAXON_ID=160619 /ORGANISM="Kryptoperidinium foliaceum, Strain CCMP 1326" /LENGTH=134 /DNA_ID=CAMNT_0017527111 /DNA_START=246 /DNA_END=650 /DNA_ORIENTATION=+